MKHENIKGRICPVCKKKFISKWNRFTKRYTVFCSRKCVRKNNRRNNSFDL